MKTKLLLLMLSCLAFCVEADNIPTTSKEGKEAYEKFQKFVSDTKRREHTTKNNINFLDKRFGSVTFYTGKLKVAGEASIAIPQDIVEHWSQWRELRVFGKNAPSLKVFIKNTDGKLEQLKHWWASKNVQYMKVDSVLQNASSSKKYEMVFKGKNALITKIALTSVPGVPMKFNFNTYSTLSDGKPIKKVKLEVFPEEERAINGIKGFDHTKFYRLYAVPTDSRAADAKMAQDYMISKNFYPGRQQLKLGPITARIKPNIREDKNNPGHPDPQWRKEFLALKNQDPEFLKLFPVESFDYAKCFDNWPRFMNVKNLPKGLFNLRGTPDEDYFDAAAQLASDFITYEKNTTGRSATWWEVKNETDVFNEWTYHRIKGKDSWKLNADFHNKVARKIKEDHPETKVGGPTTCHVKFDKKDFSFAKTQFQFMDRTAKDLDFYAYHYYGGYDIFKPQPGDAPIGGFQVNTDLLVNYMEMTKNRKPVLVSESGSHATGKTSEDFKQFYQLQGNSLTMNFFVNNPDVFNLTTLFTIPVTWWEKERKDSLFVYKKDGGFYKSPQCFLLELWSDHTGIRRIPFKINVKGVGIHAVIDKNAVLSIMISNPLQENLKIDLGVFLPEDIKVESVQQRNIVCKLGKPVYETVKPELPIVNVSAISSSQVRIKLSKLPDVQRVVDERSFYGNKTVQRGNGKNIEISFPPLPAKKSDDYVVRVGYRPDKAAKSVNVLFNGKLIGKITGKDHRGKFSPVSFKLPAHSVKSNNTVTFENVPKGAVVASAVLIGKYVVNSKALSL